MEPLLQTSEQHGYVGKQALPMTLEETRYGRTS